MSTQAAKIQIASSTPGTTGITTSFDATKGIPIIIPSYLTGRFFGELKALWIYVTATSGTPTAATMRLTKEADGDLALITDTESIISYGITTTTTGSSVWRFDIDIAIDQQMLYAFFKTDTGTFTVDKITLTYR